MKHWKWLVIILITIGLSITPAAVFADTTAVINVTNTPLFTQGIKTFTITYVSDTEMDLAWTVDATAANVMVRAKYGQYPADIPDENTAPTDGYLVYYGTDLSAMDTSMDFDENAGAIYYKAWAQKADGTWYTTTSTGSEESREVVLIGLIALGAIGSIFAIYKRQLLFAVGASAVWFLLIAFTRSNPLPNTAIGSSTDSIWISVCVAFSIATMVTTFYMRNVDSKEKQEKYLNSKDYRSEQDINRYNSRGSNYESADDYQMRLARMSKRKRQ
jgi:hypothetical protein